MYLSRVALNAKKRETMQALVIPSLMHGAVEQCFDGPRQRNLWRVDWLQDQCYLLVVSPEKPDFTQLAQQFGHQDQGQSWETRDYNLLFQRIKEGDTWKFRLKANPVHSSGSDKDPKTGRGKVHAHVTQAQQRAWLMKRSEKCGFSLEEDAFDVVNTQWEKFPKSRKDGKEITLRTATFEGALTIINSETFVETLKTGIGKAKSYGCGLLTIAP